MIGSCLIERCRTGETALSFGARPWCDVPAATSNFKPAPRVSRGTGASALAVSGMEAQHSSLLRVRAVPRSMWSVFTLSNGAATARCFSLRRKTVVRCASCGLQPKPAPRGSRGAGAAALAVSGEETQHSSLLRSACRAALVVVGPYPAKRRCAGERPPSFGARRGATCQLQPPASCQRRVTRATLARRRSLSLGRRHSTRALLRARRATLVCSLLASYQRALRQREASLFRRAAVVRRASCGLQLQACAAWLARRRCGGARCLWGGDAALELAARARGAAMVVIGPHPANGCCDGKMLLSFGARPWCDVPAAASNVKPAPRGLRRRRVCARCLWGGGAALELASRARRAALVVTGPHPANGAVPARGLLSFGARPWCDVPAAASNFKPAPRGSRGAGARCSLSLGRRRSTRACFARAPCRAGCDRFVSHRKMPHRRDGSLFWRAAVV